MKIIDSRGDAFAILFNRTDSGFGRMVGAARQLPGARFDKLTNAWIVPGSSTAQVALFARDFGFGVTEGAITLGKSYRARVEDSKASDSDFDVPGLGGTLRPFQRAGVKYALAAKRLFIADEMGLGKTVQALAAAHAANAFPMLVICPASLKLNWRREAHRWLPQRTVQVLSGRTPERLVGEIVVVNYDILRYHTDALIANKFQSAVLDESHYAKNPKAARTKACTDVCRGKRFKVGPQKGKIMDGQHEIPMRMLLSGTPLLNRPVELVSQLMILDRINDLGGFWQFAQRYCGAFKDVTGRNRSHWNMLGATNLGELNTRLRAVCFIRRQKKDVLSELPPKQRSIVPIELDNRPEYERAEREFAQWLAETGKSEGEITAALRAEQLTRIAYLKKLAATGKLEGVRDWVTTFLESGEKLVLFAHHRSIVRKLAAYFDAPSITGDTPMERRQEIVDQFQNDPNCKLVVMNMAAGGVGLTLTAASNVAFVELGWTPALHSQAEDRCHRIGQTDSVTAWYLLSDRTIDVTVYRLLSKKSAVVDSATEGGKSGKGSSIFPDLMAALRGEPDNELNGEHSEWRVDEEDPGVAYRTETPELESSRVKKPVQQASTPSEKYDETISARTEKRRETLSKGVKLSLDLTEKSPELDGGVTAAHVEKALVTLYSRQTADEQADGATRHDNGVGFSGADSAFGSDLARRILAGGHLSPKQLSAAAKMIRKYRRQLAGL